MESWIHVDKSSGQAGTNTVTISVDKSNDLYDRQGTVHVAIPGEYDIPITINQYGNWTDLDFTLGYMIQNPTKKDLHIYLVATFRRGTDYYTINGYSTKDDVVLKANTYRDSLNVMKSGFKYPTGTFKLDSFKIMYITDNGEHKPITGTIKSTSNYIDVYCNDSLQRARLSGIQGPFIEKQFYSSDFNGVNNPDETLSWAVVPNDSTDWIYLSDGSIDFSNYNINAEGTISDFRCNISEVNRLEIYVKYKTSSNSTIRDLSIDYFDGDDSGYWEVGDDIFWEDKKRNFTTDNVEDVFIVGVDFRGVANGTPQSVIWREYENAEVSFSCGSSTSYGTMDYYGYCQFDEPFSLREAYGKTWNVQLLGYGATMDSLDN